MRLNRQTQTIRIFIFTIVFGLLSACGSGSSDPDDGASGGGGGGTPPEVTSKLTLTSSTSTTEGQSGEIDMIFSLTLDTVNAKEISVDYQTSDITAAFGDDYVEASGTLLIPAGDTTASIAVSVHGDQCFENDETFSLMLSNSSSNVVLNNNEAIATITNDDIIPVLNIADASMIEGNSGQTNLAIDVSLDRPSCYITSVDYATSNVTANEPDDYVQSSGTLTIPAGDTNTTIAVAVNGDTNFENDETLTITLANISEFVELGNDSAFGTLLNDDAPYLSISNPIIAEGSSGESSNLIFALTLEGATNEVSLDYATVDGGALAADNDYTSISGTLVIPAGDTSGQISVVINGDAIVEPDEAFQLQLSNLNGFVRLTSSSATGIIIDDDSASVTPSQGVSVRYGEIIEGAATETSELIFLVNIEPAATQAITINYETENIVAEAGSDYVSKNSSVVISAGQTEAQIAITVNGDDTAEDDETFKLSILNVSNGVRLLTPFVIGLIVDDDGASTLPRMNIDISSVYEGATGETADLVLNVSLTEAVATTVTVDYASEDETALVNNDYLGTGGTLIFPAGTTQQQVHVTVIGDDFVEADERFKLLLNNLTGDAVLNHDIGIGNILTDDPFAKISIDDVAEPEGDSGTSDLIFTVSLSTVTDDDVNVNYETQNGTALDTEDYVYNSGQLVIPAGTMSSNLKITINGDIDIESDEEFSVLLSIPSGNAELLDPQGSGGIVNDDSAQGWQTPDTAGQGKDPQVSTDSAGNTTAIWVAKGDLFDFLDDIQVSLFSGGVWQASEKIGDTSNANYIDKALLSIESLGVGETITLWRDMPEFESAIYQNGSWSAASVEASTGFNRWFTQMAGSESGLAFSAWEEGTSVGSSSGKSWLAEYSNNGWNAPIELQPDASDPGSALTLRADNPLVDVNLSGNAMVVWRQRFTDDTLDRIYYRYYDAVSASWSNATSVIGTSSSSAPHQLLVYGNGDAVIVGFDGTGSSTVVAWFYDHATDQWASPSEVPASSSARLPRAVIDGNNNLFTIWTTQNTLDIYVSRYDAQTAAWNLTPTLLSVADGDSAFESDIAVDASGNAIVVWSQYVSNGSAAAQSRIRASRFTASSGVWSPAVQIDDGSIADRHGFDPTISMDSSGNAYVIWEYETVIESGGFFTTSYEIGRARYIAP